MNDMGNHFRQLQDYCYQFHILNQPERDDRNRFEQFIYRTRHSRLHNRGLITRAVNHITNCRKPKTTKAGRIEDKYNTIWKKYKMKIYVNKL